MDAARVRVLATQPLVRHEIQLRVGVRTSKIERNDETFRDQRIVRLKSLESEEV